MRFRTLWLGDAPRPPMKLMLSGTQTVKPAAQARDLKGKQTKAPADLGGATIDAF